MEKSNARSLHNLEKKPGTVLQQSEWVATSHASIYAPFKFIVQSDERLQSGSAAATLAKRPWVKLLPTQGRIASPIVCALTALAAASTDPTTTWRPCP